MVLSILSLVGTQSFATPPAQAATTLWGVDSINAITQTFVDQITTSFGKPDFFGRYLGGRYALTSPEVAVAHANGIALLLVDNRPVAQGLVTGYQTGVSAGQAAVTSAQQLGAPSGTGLYVDFETSTAMDTPFIEGWFDSVQQAGYAPGFYANTYSGQFDSKYCAAVAANPAYGNSNIWSSELEPGRSTKVTAPTYNPYRPPCAGIVNVWQYGERGSGPAPNIDTDEASNAPLWGGTASLGYEAALQANTHGLYAAGALGWANLQQAMAPGTSPALGFLPNGGYEIAFQGSNGDLFTYTGSTPTDTGLGMLSGTSPSIAVSPSGAYRVAFQANSGHLFTFDSEAGGTDLQLTMDPASSPAITALAFGGYELAYQSDAHDLLVTGDGGQTDSQQLLMSGTSPSIAGSPAGGFRVAAQASSGDLVAYDSVAGLADLQVAMDQASSPSIAALASGGYELAYQSDTHDLLVTGDGGPGDAAVVMKAGTGPAIAASPAGGYQVAFQSNGGGLYTYASSGAITSLKLGMDALSSPCNASALAGSCAPSRPATPGTPAPSPTASASPTATATPSASPSPTGPAPDTTAPRVGVYALPAVSLTNPTVRYVGTDSGSGVASFDVRYRRAPWNAAPSGYSYPGSWQGTTSRSVTAVPVQGSSYCFSVRARDNAGNVSGWSAEQCTSIPLDDRTLTASTGWARYSSRPSHYDATFTVAHSAGRTLTRTGVQARRLWLVATTCPSCGKVQVLWNGTVVSTLDLSASTARDGIVIAVPAFTAVSNGTLVLRTASAGAVSVDAVAVGR